MTAFGQPPFQLYYSDTSITKLSLYHTAETKIPSWTQRQVFPARPVNNSTDLLHNLLNKTYLTLNFPLLWVFQFHLTPCFPDGIVILPTVYAIQLKPRHCYNGAHDKTHHLLKVKWRSRQVLVKRQMEKAETFDMFILWFRIQTQKQAHLKLPMLKKNKKPKDAMLNVALIQKIMAADVTLRNVGKDQRLSFTKLIHLHSNYWMKFSVLLQAPLYDLSPGSARHVSVSYRYSSVAEDKLK